MINYRMKWSHTWIMEFNVKKCKVVLVLQLIGIISLGELSKTVLLLRKTWGSWNKHVDLIMHFQSSKDAQFPLSYMKGNN